MRISQRREFSFEDFEVWKALGQDLLSVDTQKASNLRTTLRARWNKKKKKEKKQVGRMAVEGRENLNKLEGSTSLGHDLSFPAEGTGCAQSRF